VPINGSASDDTSTRDESGVLYCANHPTVQTNLRCSRCGKPICARCRVATPVGYRCYDCADVKVLPTYAVDTSYYAKSAVAGIGAAAIIGVLWGFLPGFDFWAALIMGIVVGDLVSRMANMKRGPGLQMVGLLSVGVGVLISRAVFAFANGNAALRDLMDQIPGNIAHNGWFGLDIVGWLFVALALGLVYYRLR
jgi:hypothetical protein